MSAKRVLLFLAQGFEDLEAVTVIDACGWTAYRPHLPKVEVTTCGFHREVTGRFGVRIQVAMLAEEVDPGQYDAFVLPGGFHSHGFDEAYDSRVHELAKAIHGRGGVVATLCVGAIPIAEAGLLNGKKATTYPLSKNHDNMGRLRNAGATTVEDSFVEDNRVLSCRSPFEAIRVVTRLLEHLIGESSAHQVLRLFSGVPEPR